MHTLIAPLVLRNRMLLDNWFHSREVIGNEGASRFWLAPVVSPYSSYCHHTRC